MLPFLLRYGAQLAMVREWVAHLELAQGGCGAPENATTPVQVLRFPSHASRPTTPGLTPPAPSRIMPLKENGDLIPFFAFRPFSLRYCLQVAMVRGEEPFPCVVGAFSHCSCTL